MEYSKSTSRSYRVALLIYMSLFSLCIYEASSKRKDACGPHGVCSCSRCGAGPCVDCNGRNLLEIPQKIPDSTVILYLKRNRILNVEKDSFSNLTYLMSLYLSENMIQILDKETFSGLQGLLDLYLSGNMIQVLNKEIFSGLQSLLDLQLSRNMIQIVDKEAFSGLRRLEDLDLSANMIHELHENIFKNLPRLTNLHLTNNMIQKLHKDTFRNLTRLAKLYLSGNMIQTLEKEIFIDLQRLDTISLSGNMIQKLDKEIFSTLPKLLILDLSNNRLKFISSSFINTRINSHPLYIVLLHKNQLVYLPANAFNGLPNLRILSLFSNNIQGLDEKSFAGIRGGSIYLFGNNLSALSNASFNNENITDIHLYGNNITYINKTALIGMSDTANLYIDCRHVHELQTNIKTTCVTPTFVPVFKVGSMYLPSILENEGFQCNSRLQCYPCPRGTYGNAGECVGFPSGGFYQDEIGTSSFLESCKQCPNGTFIKDGEGKSILDCIVCPDGTNKTIFAGYRACFCLENYARTDRFGPCQICLKEGINCSGKDYISIQSGFYWNWNFWGSNLTSYIQFVKNLNVENETFDSSTKYIEEIPQVFPCPRPTNCYNSEGDLEVQCSDGYKGWLCSKCKENFYSVLNYCVPCPESAWLYTELAVITVFCVIVYAFLFRLYKREKNRSDRLFLNIIISRGKIVLGFYQVVGEFFASIHDVNWAKALKFIGEFVSFIELNVFRMIVRPKCFNENLQLNPKIEFMIGLVFPCILIASSFMLYWIMIARYKLKIRYTYTTESMPMYARKLKSKLLASVIVLLFVTYPPTCTTVFQLYPRACETFCLDMKNTTCKTLLRSDYDIQCKYLKSYHVAAYVLTVAYVGGFPTVLFFLLRNKAMRTLSSGLSGPLFAVNEETGDDLQNLVDDTSSKKTNPIWMDFLCENYKPQFWYWEIIELTRKVTSTVLITLLGWENKLTVLLTIGISVVYLTLHARYMPMKSSFEQRLQMFSLTAILSNVLVAAMDVPEEYGDEMSVAIIILNILVIIIVAAEVFLGLFIRLKHVAVHKKVFQFVMSCKTAVWNIYRKRFASDEECD